MNKYIVLEEDLIGDLLNFPIEIVQKMVNYQRIPNVQVFQKNRQNNALFKGFDWDSTEEGMSFWHKIIVNKDFNEFFEKYPITTERILTYCNEIYDRAIKNAMKQYNCDASTAFHNYIEGKDIPEWFKWNESNEGHKYWDDINNDIFKRNSNYKITYHVENRLQKQEIAESGRNDSGRSGCESKIAESCNSIIHYGYETENDGERTIVEEFEKRISSSIAIHY